MQAVNLGTKVHHPERADNPGQIPTRLEHGEVQPGADTHAPHVVDLNSGMYSPNATIVAKSSIYNPCEGPVPNNSSAEPHMIGDFHGSTNSLWSLYRKEAKSHDKARIEPLKEDMDGVLIFVRPFLSAPITESVMLIHTFTGWFILGCADVVRA